MRKIRIAQIGINTNSHGAPVYQSMKRQSDIFEIVGYALPENERERLAWQLPMLGDEYPELTLDEILNDPTIEAVTVETDEVLLSKYALMAAKAGKHIHMEKPGGVSLQAFEELIAAVKESGKVFHTGYMYRYNPFVQDLFTRVKAGELGRILSVEAQMNCSHPVAVRQWLQDFPGGMMFFLGCHLVDLILQLKGTPDNVIPLNRCTGMDGVTAQDFGMAVFEYPDGISFAKTSACEKGGFLRRQLVVTGTEGTIEINPLEVAAGGKQYTDQIECFDSNWHIPGKISRSEVYDRYDSMMASFAAMVRGEKENPWTPDYELELFKTVLKACGEKID
ncbi:MAG: Gfo/Idh/MocA family oxidoreductase [Oscillospiraceae bacterium]|nr:Gfo/Idh/MocA family oxidoreductase [Oscillospiraceae bacterium]